MRKLVVVLALCLLLTAPTLAADRLKFGVPPSADAVKTLKMFKPLADAIAAQVGVPVDLVFTPTLEAFMDRVKASEFDIVQLNHMSIIKGFASGYEVFAQYVQDGGKTTQRGLLVVRKDSGIDSIAALKGKTIGFMDDQAVSAYVLNRVLLKEHGVDLVKDMTQKFLGKHDAALMAVYNKQVDAAGIRDNTMPLLKDKIDLTQIKVLGETGRIPTLPFAVNRSLDPAQAAKVKQTILSIPNGDPIWTGQNAEGVVPCGAKELEPLLEIGRKLGL